jgi:site-specific DNA-adenine methylase
MRAVLKYPGAKWRIADWIISYMPEHRSYLEPFTDNFTEVYQQELHFLLINFCNGILLSCVKNSSFIDLLEVKLYYSISS